MLAAGAYPLGEGTALNTSRGAGSVDRAERVVATRPTGWAGRRG